MHTGHVSLPVTHPKKSDYQFSSSFAGHVFLKSIPRQTNVNIYIYINSFLESQACVSSSPLPDEPPPLSSHITVLFVVSVSPAAQTEPCVAAAVVLNCSSDVKEINKETEDILLNHRCDHWKCLCSPEEKLFRKSCRSNCSMKKWEKTLAKHLVAAGGVNTLRHFNNKLLSWQLNHQ